MKVMKQENKYIEVKKRVAKQKNFYNHLQLFVIMMILLLLFSNKIFNFFESHIHNPNSLKWARANVWVNALIWFVVIIIHGIYAFKCKIPFIDNWEKRKVDEFMNDND